MYDEYVRLNDHPIAIEYVADEHDPDRDFTPSFWYGNERHYLDDFVRTHDNPWVGGDWGWPDHIHGYEADNYYNPLFIEVVDGGDAVNVYESAR